MDSGSPTIRSLQRSHPADIRSLPHPIHKRFTGRNIPGYTLFQYLRWGCSGCNPRTSAIAQRNTSGSQSSLHYICAFSYLHIRQSNPISAAINNCSRSHQCLGPRSLPCGLVFPQSPSTQSRRDMHGSIDANPSARHSSKARGKDPFRIQYYRGRSTATSMVAPSLLGLVTNIYLLHLHILLNH